MPDFKRIPILLIMWFIILGLLVAQIIYNPSNFWLLIVLIFVVVIRLADFQDLKKKQADIQERNSNIAYYDRQEERLKAEIQLLQREANFYRLIQRLFERTSGRDLDAIIKAVIDILKVALDGSIVFYFEKDFTGHYSLVDSSIANISLSDLNTLFSNPGIKDILENKSSGTLTDININLGEWGMMHSAWVLPLVSTMGNVSGVIIVMYPMSDISLEGMTEAWLLERNISMIIELATIHEAERGMAFKDPLTSAYNRNFMLTAIQKDIDRAKLRGEGVYVCMLDIDNFKKFNDTYGHDAGDIVLKSIVHEARRKIRSADYLVRYGGEEFIIVFVNTDKDNAFICAERVREAIADMSLSFEGEEVKVTCSFGLAPVLPDKGLEQAITMADKALYKAKANGKNRVEVVELIDSDSFSL